MQVCKALVDLQFFVWLYYSHISQPFGHVSHNFIDVMKGNIFRLVDQRKGEITETLQKSYLTSKFSHVYKVLLLFSKQFRPHTLVHNWCILNYYILLTVMCLFSSFHSY